LMHRWMSNSQLPLLANAHASESPFSFDYTSVEHGHVLPPNNIITPWWRSQR
jgi:hypothetical protein